MSPPAIAINVSPVPLPGHLRDHTVRQLLLADMWLAEDALRSAPLNMHRAIIFQASIVCSVVAAIYPIEGK